MDSLCWHAPLVWLGELDYAKIFLIHTFGLCFVLLIKVQSNPWYWHIGSWSSDLYSLFIRKADIVQLYGPITDQMVLDGPILLIQIWLVSD